MRGITKSFAGVQALRGVDLQIVPGEVHCVLGQNGAGKSTLIKTLAGVHRPDEGRSRGMARSSRSPTPQAALDARHRHDVSGARRRRRPDHRGEHLPRPRARRAAASRSARRRTGRPRALLKRLGHGNISPNPEVGQLTAANKQIVSMARALSHDIKLIIMDEPSAVLDTEEVKNLFRVVRELTAEGIAVIYITHRLEEIRADRRPHHGAEGRRARMATGLARRRHAHPRAHQADDRPRRGERVPARRRRSADAPVVLEVEGLDLRGRLRGRQLHGARGRGRRARRTRRLGAIGDPRDRVRRAHARHPAPCASRGKRCGTARSRTRSMRASGSRPRSARARASCSRSRSSSTSPSPTSAGSRKAGFLNERAERKAAREQIEALELRPADPDRAARTLSGGNQQKILLARWLVHGTRVLLLDEPTRGVDVGARAEIYALIRRLAAAGNAVVVVSSEIEEVLGLADRVLVIADGRVLTPPQTDRRARRARPRHERNRRVSEQTRADAVGAAPSRRRRCRATPDKPEPRWRRVLERLGRPQPRPHHRAACSS